MTVRVNAQGYLEEGEPAPVEDDTILSSDPHAGVILSSDPHAGLQAAAPEKHQIRDFFTDLVGDSPFNPVNVVKALLPGENIGHTLDALRNEFVPDEKAKQEARGHASNIITGNDPQGRLAALEKLYTGIIGNIPLIGKGAIKSGEHAIEGDYGKAAAGVVNNASQFAVPEVAGRIPGALKASAGPVGRTAQGLGRGMEAVGDATMKPNMLAVPSITALSHPWVAAAELALPPALKFGGKGVQAAGRALEGLGDSAGAGSVVEHGSAQFSPRAGAATVRPGTMRQGGPADMPIEAPSIVSSGADAYGPQARQAHASNTMRQGGAAESALEPPSPVLSDAAMFHGSGAAYAEGPRPSAGTLRQGGPSEPMPDVRQSVSSLDALESPLDAAARQSTRDVNAARLAESEPPPSLTTLDEPVTPIDGPLSPPTTAEPPAGRTDVERLIEETEALPEDLETTPPERITDSGPTYSQWAQDIDDIVNSAGPGDMPRQHGTGLGASKPTKAIQRWMAGRRAESLADGTLATERGVAPEMPASWKALLDTPPEPLPKIRPRRKYTNTNDPKRK